MKILVVDDNIMDRKYVKYLLENHLNISPESAKDGLEALKKIKSVAYDLVITDVVMPKMEGMELIKQIKTLCPKTEVIAVSGNNPYYLYILNKMGVEHTFSKPIDTYKFIEVVSRLMDKSKKEVLIG